ncbi:MAG: hypothetical protein GX282_03585 [Campylobacteraceae bacterium]|nr:hypothetical protein [Campylobacteraceae bacterium]
MVFSKLQTKIANLTSVERQILSKSLGYHSYGKFEKAFAKFLIAKSLDEYLYSGYFDYQHTSESLVKKLAQIFALNIENELKDAINLNNEAKKYENDYIYIDTNFKRKNESIFMLALSQSSRYVEFDKKELCFKSLEERLKFISNLITTHYAKVRILPIFGKITGYRFVHLGQKYDFDTGGNLSGKEISESVTWISF